MLQRAFSHRRALFSDQEMRCFWRASRRTRWFTWRDIPASSAHKDFLAYADRKMILASFIHHSAAFSVVLPACVSRRKCRLRMKISEKKHLVNGSRDLYARAGKLSRRHAPKNIVYRIPISFITRRGFWMWHQRAGYIISRETYQLLCITIHFVH
jgi:hypothetical protein